MEMLFSSILYFQEAIKIKQFDTLKLEVIHSRTLSEPAAGYIMIVNFFLFISKTIYDHVVVAKTWTEELETKSRHTEEPYTVDISE